MNWDHVWPRMQATVYMRSARFLRSAIVLIPRPHFPSHRLSTRMVVFRDRAVIAQDFRAYAFTAKHMSSSSLLKPSFDFGSGDHEARERPEWSLHVSPPPGREGPPLTNISNNNNSALRF